MRRRDFTVLVASAALNLPRASSAQPAGPRRIGVLVSYALRQSHPAIGFPRGLKELGYVEGRDVVLEWRSADGNAARFPALAKELVRAKVDIIMAGTNPAIDAARSATRTIPIVMAIATDPVANGFVPNLAHPGGNLTGASIQSDELAVKRIQLLKEALPRLSRVAVVAAPGEAMRSKSAKALEQAVREFGLQVRTIAVREPSELEAAFVSISKERGEAAIVAGSTLLFAQRSMIAKLAIEHHVPTLGSTRVYAEAGLLLSYGANFEESYRRAAFYVDKILKGATPGELPIELPTKFELLINAKTAKALGIKLSSAVLARADEIVQ